MKYERGSFITVGSRDTLRGLHPTAQALYMWLSSYANETGNCFPSRKTLAKDAGCSENSVDRMLDLLYEKGLLIKKHQKKGEVYTSNLYTVLVVGGGPTQQPPSPHTAATVPPDVRTNSNQLNQTTELAVAKPPVIEFSLEKEDRPEKKSSAKYPNAKKVFSLWGNYPKIWEKNTSICMSGEWLYEEKGMEELQELFAWYAQHKTEQYCPKFHDPISLVEKYPKLEDHLARTS